MIKMQWVQISALHRWQKLFCDVCLKRPKIKYKRPVLAHSFGHVWIFWGQKCFAKLAPEKSIVLWPAIVAIYYYLKSNRVKIFIQASDHSCSIFALKNLFFYWSFSIIFSVVIMFWSKQRNVVAYSQCKFFVA